MNSFLLFLFLSINNFIYSEGFIAGTLVKKQSKYVAIEDLKKDDLISSYDFQENKFVDGRIIKCDKVTLNRYIRITINEKSIGLSPKQKFYIPFIKQWVIAQDLKDDLTLIKTLFATQNIQIDEIETDIELYKISLDKYHNFYVTEDNILVHNFAIPFLFAFGGGIELLVGESLTLLAAFGIASLVDNVK